MRYLLAQVGWLFCDLLVWLFRFTLLLHTGQMKNASSRSIVPTFTRDLRVRTNFKAQLKSSSVLLHWSLLDYSRTWLQSWYESVPSSHQNYLGKSSLTMWCLLSRPKSQNFPQYYAEHRLELSSAGSNFAKSRSRASGYFIVPKSDCEVNRPNYRQKEIFFPLPQRTMASTCTQTDSVAGCYDRMGQGQVAYWCFWRSGIPFAEVFSF